MTRRPLGPSGIGRRRWLASALGAVAAAAFADERPWPSRPITLVVGAAPGSNGDLLCRFIGSGLQEVFRQPVVIDNRVGASGAIAALTVVRARPDGHTLLFGNASSTVVSQAAAARPAFDPLSDLAAVAQIGVGGVPLVVSPGFPARTMGEFLAVVKANPGRYQYATWGVGTTGQLIMDWIKSRTGIRIDDVPYPSIPAIVHDLIGGTIDVAFLDSGTAAPLQRSGRIRVLAVSGTRRSPALPEVPLMREQGVGFDVDGWYGIFAPSGTPGTIVAALNREITQLLADPELGERLASLNVAGTPAKSAEAFARTVADDYAVWRAIAQGNKLGAR